jgi:hypothetical protein
MSFSLKSSNDYVFFLHLGRQSLMIRGTSNIEGAFTMVKAGPTLDKTMLQATENVPPAPTRGGFIAPLQLHDVNRTVDHLLLRPNSAVAVISPDEGMSAASYARARPHWQVVSWVPDIKTLLRAQNIHTDGNIVFDKQPVPGKRSVQNVEAVIAVGWAHHLYSSGNYNLNALFSGVQELLWQLPVGGQLLIQDFALPDEPDKFVLLDIENADAAEALRRFARTARPQAPSPLQGFFLETLPGPRAGMFRFRLSAKWATEFFHRWRLGIAADAPFELTTLSVEQWAALAEQTGGRASYRAPHPLAAEEAKKLRKTIQFLDENENKLPLPPATFTILIEKPQANDGVVIYERRPSEQPPRDLALKTVKSPHTDKPTDWIDVKQTADDILPWRKDAAGDLRVWVQVNVPRPVVNTVPRGTPNLDGRRWAGYLTEPLAVLADNGPLDQDAIRDKIAVATGVDAAQVREVHIGLDYYPAPEYLAQRVRGLFVEVTRALPAVDTHVPSEENPGRIIEVMADDLYRALTVGLIPDSKLEILLTCLMQELGLRPKVTGEALKDPAHTKLVSKLVRPPEARAVKTVKKNEELMDYMTDAGEGVMKPVRSVFVADQAGPLGRQALRVTESDFIVPGRLSANTAVCIPMLRNPLGKFMMGTQPRTLPIPDRMGNSDPLLSLPSFRLPENLTTIEAVIAFLSKQIECSVDDITPFGMSFFLQPQLSPERVYPFIVHAPDRGYRWDRLTKPQGRLNKLYDRPVEKTAAYIEMKAQRVLGEFYVGFSPDIGADMTKKVETAPQPFTTVTPQFDHDMPLGPRPE